MEPWLTAKLRLVLYTGCIQPSALRQGRLPDYSHAYEHCTVLHHLRELARKLLGQVTRCG